MTWNAVDVAVLLSKIINPKSADAPEVAVALNVAIAHIKDLEREVEALKKRIEAID